MKTMEQYIIERLEKLEAENDRLLDLLKATQSELATKLIMIDRVAHIFQMDRFSTGEPFIRVNYIHKNFDGDDYDTLVQLFHLAYAEETEE